MNSHNTTFAFNKKDLLVAQIPDALAQNVFVEAACEVALQ